MQNYFEVTVHTLCGIPTITLEGSAQEWAILRERTKILGEIGLSEWQVSLDAVLAQFVGAAQGEINQRFWSEIYKRENASGGERISGWINVLFPFLGDNGVALTNPLATFGEHWPAHALEGNGVKQFAPGLVSAPFNWKVMMVDQPMSLVAGFTGVAQDPTGTVRSRVGWAVTSRTDWRHYAIMPNGNIVPGVPCLMLRQGESPDNLQGIADETKHLASWGIELSFKQSVRSLTGLEHTAGLHYVALLSIPIVSLEPLRNHQTLAHLSIAQCDGVKDISVIASLPNLRKLAINHCNHITDWSPLLSPSLAALEELSWFGASVPSGFVGIFRGREAVQDILNKYRARSK